MYGKYVRNLTYFNLFSITLKSTTEAHKSRSSKLGAVPFLCRHNQSEAMEFIDRHTGTRGMLSRPTCSGCKMPRFQGRNYFRHGFFFFAGVCAFLFAAISSQAQGTFSFVVLQTGGDSSLVSNQQVVPFDGSAGQQLTFNFGFFTAESSTPGTFLDSFTVTLQDASSDTAVLSVIDASGTIWAPPSAGGIVLSDSDITRMAIMPPGGSPILGQGVGYSVTVAIPQQMVGPQLTLYFDLYDNQDSNMSTGWFSPPNIFPIPEPGVASLFALALLGVIIRRKRIHAVRKL